MNNSTLIGKSIVRHDAWDKVTGQALYANDFSLEGELHMKLVFAERPHARILSIDISTALAQPGVITILTGKDVPNNIYGLIKADQPVLCENKVRFVGDQICAVVAETREQAERAAKFVRLSFHDLQVVADPQSAMSPNAVLVHEDRTDNIAHKVQLRRGDVVSAFAESDVIIEREYQTPMQEHAYLEPEAGVGFIDEEGRVTVRTSGQSTHDDQRQIAHALDLPLEKVRVVYGAIGGAFGGREDISVQIVLALAAWKLQRPVRLAWSREESIAGHGKRHAITLRYKWGAKKDGKILAAQVEAVTDAGAYLSTSGDVIDNFRFSAIGAYQIPNVNVDATTVFTNNIPGGAFRGFGSPQTAFAAELQIEHLAEELGMDSTVLRMKNCLIDNSTLPTQSKIPGPVSLSLLLETLSETLDNQQDDLQPAMKSLPYSHSKKRGRGIAIGIKNSGFSFGFPEGSEARVVLNGGAEIEYAELYTAAADVGQGAHSVLAQIAAEVLGIPVAAIKLTPSDTATIGDSGPASASRLTIFAGNAVKQAAEQALANFKAEDRPAIGGGRWDAPPTEKPDPETGSCFNSLSYAYGAQAVEVEVDTETGEIKILKIIAVHDPGKAINPQQVIGQIQGSLVQAQGWVLTENFIIEEGFVHSDKLSTYLIPTILDVPTEMECVLVERPDPFGPFGVRGIGEIAFVCLAPALISAVHNATGIWFNHIPILPEQVIAALHPKSNLQG